MPQRAPPERVGDDAIPNPSATLRILIVDDHPLVLAGLKSELPFEPTLRVVGALRDPSDLVAAATRLKPSVLVMDLELGPPSGTIPLGIKLIPDLLAELPELNILVLSRHDEPGIIARSLFAGARGYAHKSEDGQALIRAIQAVGRGETWVSPHLEKATQREMLVLQEEWRRTDRFDRLTLREREVMELTVEGWSLSRIAQVLRISKRTVERHRLNLMEKLEVRGMDALLELVRGSRKGPE